VDNLWILVPGRLIVDIDGPCISPNPTAATCSNVDIMEKTVRIV